VEFLGQIRVPGYAGPRPISSPVQLPFIEIVKLSEEKLQKAGGRIGPFGEHFGVQPSDTNCRTSGPAQERGSAFYFD
jgi:hypothetical protein